jgi:hypothetical protein
LKIDYRYASLCIAEQIVAIMPDYVFPMFQNAFIGNVAINDYEGRDNLV